MAVIAAVLAVLAPPPAQAQVAVRTVQPKVRELDKYSDLWHRCRRAEGCVAGRNVRRHGIRFKWVSESGERRHWGAREPRARDVGRRIRVMRAKLAAVTLLPFAGPGGSRWAIPWRIVACESGGSWSAANPSGAIGPYQLLGKGAPWPANTARARWTHHRIAARLWAGGAGASHWVCKA